VIKRKTIADIWPDACAWCGATLDQRGTGRPRRYCRAACRQRAYEQRRVEQTVAPVRAELERTSWRLDAWRGDLNDLLGQAEALVGSADAGAGPATLRWCEAVIDVADPVRFTQRHGRPPPFANERRLGR
jgi:hypothetical protein